MVEALIEVVSFVLCDEAPVGTASSRRRYLQWCAFAFLLSISVLGDGVLSVVLLAVGIRVVGVNVMFQQRMLLVCVFYSSTTVINGLAQCTPHGAVRLVYAAVCSVGLLGFSLKINTVSAQGIRLICGCFFLVDARHTYLDQQPPFLTARPSQLATSLLRVLC